MRRSSKAGWLLLVAVRLAPAAAAGPPGVGAPGEIRWDEVPAAAVAAIPFRAVDPAILEHPHERRGFVSVPLDYSQPADRKIDIFYRLMPSRGSTAAETGSPILVVMNGGPGVPSSVYRPLDHDYDHDDRSGGDDAFAELSKHFRILAVDQRGTGGSAPLDLDDPALSPQVIARLFDSDEHARDHARVIEAVVPEAEGFFILARSYGGEIGFQYLTLVDGRRWPAGIVFDSALLPHSDGLGTFLRRRLRQLELNLELRAAHPEIVDKLERLRGHLGSLGMEPANVHFLWPYLGRGVGWPLELERRVDELLAVGSRQRMEVELGRGIRGSLNLLNYVLSSAALTPGYTDRTMARETSRWIPFDGWMLDESWTLGQIAVEGTWREAFVASVDSHPPPPTRFPPLEEIRAALGEVHALFTFGVSDAFLPHDLQLARAQRLQVPGHTEIRVFAGGHGAAFSAEGAAAVAEWAARTLGDEPRENDFVGLVNRVAEGWRRRDTELSLSAFTEDAVYMEPPDLLLFRGHAELRRFFDAVHPGSSMTWHRLWYDEETGIGAGEYSFHNGGRSTAAHGVAVVEIRDGRISLWREYQRRGAIAFEKFLEIEGKRWEWTVDSLPPSRPAASGTAQLEDFRPLLDFNDPVATEERLSALLPAAREQRGAGYLAELLTQIARTHSRRGDFEAAHRVLDEAETLLSDDHPRAKVRYWLERGRTFNLAADRKGEALALFRRAFDLAERIGSENLSVDAAHMIAMGEASFEGQLEWTLKALSIAERASDPETRKWAVSLTTNLGWTYFDHGDYEAALEYFERALAQRRGRDEADPALTARWNVGRAYRALGRFDEALALQEELLSDYESRGLPVYGYVYEELAELLHRDDDPRAPAYFRLAYEALSDEVWMVNHQAERLARLRELGWVTTSDDPP